jgi:hypothetical protein
MLRLHRSNARSLVAGFARLLPLLAVALLARPAAAQDPVGARDEWQLMYMGEAKIGFLHVVLEPVEQDGKRVWRSTNDSSMTLNRLGTNISVLSLVTIVEDEAGQILTLDSESNMSISKSRTRVTVKGAQAEVVKQIAGPPQVMTIDWDKEWLGSRGSEVDSRRRIQAGEKSYVTKSWSPETGAMVSTTEIVGPEKVAVPGSGEQELLRTRTTVDVQPGMVLDAFLHPGSLETVMTSTKMAGMVITTVVSDKAACLAAFANPDTPEVFNRLSPRTNVRLPNPYKSDEIVLHLTASDPDAPLPSLEDERQTIVERKGKDDVVLRVRKVVPEQAFTLPLTGFTDYERECLEPNLQIECDHAGIVALAKQAVGDEKDAWKAACKLERFAYEYITNKSMSSLFETAVKVMETRSGDCTEHGVFLASICRAAGIPARVAVGFLYFKGIWGGHMWSEVSLGGKWYALDAVLGLGGVDAGHVRLAADSLKSTEIARVFADVTLGLTMKMDLLSYRHGDKTVEVGANPVVFKIDGARYRHLLFDVALTAPDGWTITPNKNISLGDDEIVELTKEGGGKIEIVVTDVTYDFKLDHAKAVLESYGMTRLKPKELTIDGRAARRFLGKKEKAEALAAAVLREQTLILVTASAADEAAFDAVVTSLDLDG